MKQHPMSSLGAPYSAPPRDASFSERIKAQREQLFRAMSIVEACRLGSDSMLAPIHGGEEPELGDALAAAHDLIKGVARELEALIPRARADA